MTQPQPLLTDERRCKQITKQIREWREEDRRAGLIWEGDK